MDIEIRQINDDENEIGLVQDFLYDQIKKEYGIGPTPKFHYDIESMGDYYIIPERNTFFVACDGDKIVASIGLRGYDLDYDFFKDEYTKDDTASIWRLMVDENYRRHGLARNLVAKIEDFASSKSYDKIYLHTHRYLEAGLPFWKSLGYKITVEEDDYDETTHMIKYLNKY
ncbi:MAG: GNAT family N-acetyltransferase [Methanobrevibacter millerae]|uniref:GNAT family N-acetyltransferase n=1 Tax=Methanobrevibacter millerae TaxID=230361 RepID=A0A8T3VAG2_9EURY|nr:GNAT family N-acetyltransferase [Methanobrevibacter millerae]MBE6505028.1 GNAT family N-acetyltransferase [Methanobrevibacter millerae]